jgi:hypothetical protein
MAAKKTAAKKPKEEEKEGVNTTGESETGENTAGVQSPHDGVGEEVPGDVVMPGEVVDPKSGAVLPGGGTQLATPRPNLTDDGGRVSAKPGQEWAGNHTV